MTTTEPDTTQWKRTPDGIPIPPPSPDDVLYESLDGFARITMNRPIVLNALNKSMQRGIDAALDRAEADEQAKAIILTGAGRAFCAGGPGRYQHQRLHSSGVRIQSLHERDAKGGGFACAGLGLAHYVLSGAHRRNHRFLYGGWGGISHAL